MRGAEKLFDAITEVREDLVEEALDYRFQAKKAVPWQRYAKWAACLALVVCIGYLAANLDLRMGGMNSAAGNSASVLRPLSRKMLQIAAVAAKNAITGMVTPVARPSIPSVRLTAFTQPTITNMAKII